MLLGLAWLLPLASFALIVLFGPRMGKAGVTAGYLATGAIVHVVRCCRCLRCCCVWLPHTIGCPRRARMRRSRHASAAEHDADAAAMTARRTARAAAVKPITGDWYTLGQFGSLRDHDRLLHRLADRR